MNDSQEKLMQYMLLFLMGCGCLAMAKLTYFILFGIRS